MIKSGKTVLIVDSVENAVKFYTEKLAFDIVELHVDKTDSNKEILTYAQLKKGKCFIMFRTPNIEELAEFSFIKRCASRCVGVFAEMKKGLDKYFNKCNKKGVQIISEPKEQSWGYKTFEIKDPFGIKLTFAEAISSHKQPNNFCGTSNISKNDISGDSEKDSQILDRMIKYLKNFGILRRASKKYSKLWIKLAKKNKSI